MCQLSNHICLSVQQAAIDTGDAELVLLIMKFHPGNRVVQHDGLQAILQISRDTRKPCFKPNSNDHISLVPLSTLSKLAGNSGQESCSGSCNRRHERATNR